MKKMGKYVFACRRQLKTRGAERERGTRRRKRRRRRKRNSFYFLPVWGIILYIFRLS